MNMEKGLKRLTIVLSILAGPFMYIYLITFIPTLIATYGDGIAGRFEFLIWLLIFEVIGFFVVWIIYWVMCWIVKGFHADNPKDEQNNK